jgi:2-methylaconitate cis-trans-isomerase PrpF
VAQRKIAAVYMRGGTSKGVFFRPEDLPANTVLRDKILLRVIGSPDPYAKQTDGKGGATSTTNKVVLVGSSSHPDCGVDSLFVATSIETPVIDWSGKYGNLTSPVGPFAVARDFVKAPKDCRAIVLICTYSCHRLSPPNSGHLHHDYGYCHA